jgi:hypothetical protein
MVGDWVVGPTVASLHSHPRFGTWEVQGLILASFRELGEDSGELGNPTSGGRQVAPGVVSWFEHVSVIFDAQDGSVTVTTTA